jgi:hypothetical protein
LASGDDAGVGDVALGVRLLRLRERGGDRKTGASNEQLVHDVTVLRLSSS